MKSSYADAASFASSIASSTGLLAHDDKPLGRLCLRRRELIGRPGTVVTEITLDHEFLMSSYITDSERALSSLALELGDLHPNRVAGRRCSS